MVGDGIGIASLVLTLLIWLDQDWGTLFDENGHIDNAHSPRRQQTILLNNHYNYFIVIGDIITYVIYLKSNNTLKRLDKKIDNY